MTVEVYLCIVGFFFFKQKTAYEMNISDWSSDVCSSDLAVSADVYPYIAAGTGLDASMPPWLFDGGMEAGIARLDDPSTRRRAIADMQTKCDWENVLRMAGPDTANLAGVRTTDLRPMIGTTVAVLGDGQNGRTTGRDKKWREEQERMDEE